MLLWLCDGADGLAADQRFDRRYGKEDTLLGAELGYLTPERDRAVIDRFVEFLGVAVSSPHSGSDGRRCPGVTGCTNAL
jgi:hypothetical protein